MSSAALLERIPALRTRFLEICADVPFVARGVLFSEMVFLVAALGSRPPRRLVESGRARGQSTLLLARLLPETEIVSVERYDDADAAFARERLAPHDNVELITGDARVELPARVRPGDAVLIDGPKGWRALRLAFRLLARNEPAAVFVHDCQRGTPWRRFLDHRHPRPVFSDAAELVAATRDLDAPHDPSSAWRPHHFHGADQESYGPTLAWLRPPVPRSSRTALEWAALRQRLGASLRRRTGGSAE